MLRTSPAATIPNPATKKVGKICKGGFSKTFCQKDVVHLHDESEAGPPLGHGELLGGDAGHRRLCTCGSHPDAGSSISSKRAVTPCPPSSTSTSTTSCSPLSSKQAGSFPPPSKSTGIRSLPSLQPRCVVPGSPEKRKCRFFKVFFIAATCWKWFSTSAWTMLVCSKAKDAPPRRPQPGNGNKLSKNGNK